MKHERRAKVQVVVQMVLLDRNAGEVEDFMRFWRAVPGIDQVRVKADETNLLQPDAAHKPEDWKHPCHYLWRGPMYVKQNGDVYPCCQSYMLDGKPAGNLGSDPLAEIWNSALMQKWRRYHVEGRAGEIGVCSRCFTTIPHPALVAGSLILHGKTVRSLLPLVERLVYFSKLPARWLNPPKPVIATRSDLVQIGEKPKGE
jgi:radical SAM protein with 4Fe4S-binding SPASM domain